ncbi:MAG: Hpt domain-containing protein [Lentisphaerae bacterium]|nr:MAG: Hpt domain-containing protein [Lentisphaerota bacterium]
MTGSGVPPANLSDPVSESELRDMQAISFETLDFFKHGSPANGKEIVEDLLRVYFKSFNEKLPKLRNAIADGDLHQVRELAHSLKGSSANIGLNSLAEICRKIESDAERGAVDNYNVQLELLEAEAQYVRKRLDQYMAQFDQ